MINGAVFRATLTVAFFWLISFGPTLSVHTQAKSEDLPKLLTVREQRCSRAVAQKAFGHDASADDATTENRHVDRRE